MRGWMRRAERGSKMATRMWPPMWWAGSVGAFAGLEPSARREALSLVRYGIDADPSAQTSRRGTCMERRLASVARFWVNAVW